MVIIFLQSSAAIAFEDSFCQNNSWLVHHLHTYSDVSEPPLPRLFAQFSLSLNSWGLEVPTSPVRSRWNLPPSLVKMAQNWFSHPLWLSAEEIVCFFPLHSVRVDEDEPRGPSWPFIIEFPEKPPGLRPQRAEERRRCRAASDWISCGLEHLNSLIFTLTASCVVR